VLPHDASLSDCAVRGAKVQRLSASGRVPAFETGHPVDMAVEERYTVAMLRCCGRVHLLSYDDGWGTNR